MAKRYTDGELLLCSRCKVRPRRYQERDANGRLNPNSRCAECHTEVTLESRRKQSAEKRLEVSRRDKLRARYGLTDEQYLAKLEAQGGVCGACGEPANPEVRLHVDHDHKCCPGQNTCGQCVRDLLCTYCNLLVGRLEREDFSAQMYYIEKWNSFS